MSQLLGERAVVIGAGMGGLSASAALAPHFEQVLLLERDAISSWEPISLEPAPLEPVPRPGVPQGRHLHTLLGGGQRALEALFPGLEVDLLQAGAVRYRAGLDLWLERPGFDPFPQRDVGWNCYSLSRPLLESLVRARAVRGNVALRAGCRVERIQLSADGARVTGVECSSRTGPAELLSAQLVIDASGRAAPTLAALQASGASVPRETHIGVDLGYATQLFQMPEAAPSNWKLAL
ncbi:MAG: hypothetical protein RL685_5270, partial [Pseudomonadota bacterium]